MTPSPAQPASPTTRPSTQYVGFGRRFLAFAVDGIILSIVSLSLGISFNFGNKGGYAFFPSVIIYVGYFVYFWVKQNGQTLGNRLLAIRVVREDGKLLDVGTGIVRYLGYILSGFVFGLGYLWVIFDSKKQGWHDKIAKTVVVESGDKPRTGLAILIVVLFYLVFFIFMGFMIIALFAAVQLAKQNPKAFQQQLQRSNDRGTNPLNKAINEFATITQEQADGLARETFTEVNNYREEGSLTLFKEDSRLCAYGQRRLEQLTTLGKFDDHKGFYEDTADNTTVRSYFPNYTKANEAIYYQLLTPATRALDIVVSWKPVGEGVYAIAEAEATGGCVRANPQFVVLITGTP